MDYTHTAAVLSPDKLYRYQLHRSWRHPDEARTVCTFIGLNPSTADASEDDPTIRRCVRFADDWGCTDLYMVNLFAFRSTDPQNLLSMRDPVGPENDRYLIEACLQSNIIVAAWGAHKMARKRDAEVRSLMVGGRRMASLLRCLGTTKDGSPKHPLYIKADTILEDYRP